MVATDAMVPARVIAHTDYDSRAGFEEALDAALVAHGIELICLAGFMRVLTPGFVEAWSGKMINIHPSLLPKYKGLHTHRRALEAGDLEAGCTVHFVSSGVDEGEIISQARVPVMADDTEETLAARVLAQEHVIYPQALKQLILKDATL